jgi:hypothetical protein
VNISGFLSIWRRLIGLSVLVTCLTVYVLVWQPVRLYFWKDFRRAGSTITRIEKYQRLHGRLPDTLREVGVDDADNQLFYMKIDEQHYTVWFPTTLGESEIYDSANRSWR